ncbi:hypothetical protein RJT34_12195 [Clitoria ternatea]|uniref:AP2/ERF domain-containing protein n=1 Tax=Clitoria ternatea TaxID=43366 RepID=A0AAN9JLH1_CLITE
MVKAESKIQNTEASSASKPMRPLSASSTTSNDKNKKKYKGVRMRSWGSWVSEIRAPNQKTRIWLGSYSTAEAAARAYDAALLCLKGSSANLNFPSSSSSLFIPQDTVMSPKSIQKVAAAAANSFVDNNNAIANANVNVTAATTPSSSSTSLVSSPSSMSSSSSSPSDHQIDDGVSLLSSFGGHTDTTTTSSDQMAMMESWYGLDCLQSPKYVDQMLSGAFFDFDSSHLLLGDDLYQESDIPLWSFC